MSKGMFPKAATPKPPVKGKAPPMVEKPKGAKGKGKGGKGC